MLFALLGAPCGHAAPLRAALDALDDRGILTILHAGNLAVGGPDPGGVIALLDERGVAGVQGEDDRTTVLFTRKADAMRARLEPAQYDAVAAARAAMRAREVEFLRSLPRQRHIEVDGYSIHLCHGSVSAQAGRIAPDDPPDRLRRHREQANADCVAVGKHPDPWHTVVDGTLFVCAGTMAADAGRYSIINTDTRPWSVQPCVASPAHGGRSQ